MTCQFYKGLCKTIDSQDHVDLKQNETERFILQLTMEIEKKKKKNYEGPSKDYYPKFEFMQFICFQNDIKEIPI